MKRTTHFVGFMSDIKKENGRLYPSVDRDEVEEDNTELLNELTIDQCGTLDYYIKEQIRRNY